MTHLGVEFCVCVCFLQLEIDWSVARKQLQIRQCRKSADASKKLKSRNQNYDYKWRKGEILRIEARCAVSRGPLCLSTTDYCCCCFPSSAVWCSSVLAVEPIKTYWIRMSGREEGAEKRREAHKETCRPETSSNCTERKGYRNRFLFSFFLLPQRCQSVVESAAMDTVTTFASRLPSL